MELESREGFLKCTQQEFSKCLLMGVPRGEKRIEESLDLSFFIFFFD
jgi:hypothetical protein